MKRWDLILGFVSVAGALYDLYNRDWLSAGQYLSLGACLLLGPDRPGAGKVPAMVFGVAAVGLFVIRVALSR